MDIGLKRIMKDRFDLENEISALHNFVDHLNIISEGVLTNDLDKDEASSAIIGVSILLKLQADKLYDTMCQCFKLNSYNHVS